MKMFYELCLEMKDGDDMITTQLGKGTEYEALSVVGKNLQSGEWTGYILFRDQRFSPPDPEFPLIQFQYITPYAGSGTLAVARATETWETLVGIFTALCKGESHA